MFKQNLQHEVDDTNLKAKQENFALKAKQNEIANLESRQLLQDYHNKILLYSAGAFSFTLTLVGLAVDEKVEALAKVGFIMPNVFWLYASWVFFLAAAISVLLGRKFDSYYIANFGMAEYTKSYKDKVKEEMRFVKDNEQRVLSNQTPEDFIEIAKKNIAKLTTASEENTERQQRYYKIMRLFQTLSELFAVAGVILLFFFGTQLTQAIIWS